MERRRKALLYALAIVGGGYGCYSLYKSDYVQRKKHRLARLLKAGGNLLDAVTSVADSAALLSADMEAFLRSDDDQVPQSIKQVFKLIGCSEFQDVVVGYTSRISKAVMPNRGPRAQRRGLVVLKPVPDVSSSESSSKEARTKKPWARTERRKPPSGFTETVLTMLFTDAGKGFASVVAGHAARSFALCILEEIRKSSQDEDKLEPSSWEAEPLLELACTSKGKALLCACIQVMVETAVSTYLDKTQDVNVFEELVEALTEPAHQAPAKDLLVSVSNGAVETLVRSYQQASIQGEARKMTTLGAISKALEVPSNRKLVLDVAGTVTAQAMDSSLGALVRSSKAAVCGSQRAFFLFMLLAVAIVLRVMARTVAVILSR